MGWFEKQIEQREELDRQMFEDSFLRAAQAVVGRRAGSEMADKRIITRYAIEDLMKYYHYRPVEIPDRITDYDRQLEYCLHAYGIMRREIELEENWYNNSYGPVLAYRKDDATAVALLPNKISGYHYIDRKSGKKVVINKKNMQLFEGKGFCFYKPLPQKELTIRDLLAYIGGCISTSDRAMAIISVFAVTLIGLFIPRITKALTGPILQNGEFMGLMGAAICLVCIAITSSLLKTISGLVTQRLMVKTSVNVEAAMFMRILSLPASFFRKFSAGELTKRSQSINMLCTTIVRMLYSTVLSSLISLLYVTQIFEFAPVLVGPALLIVVINASVMIISVNVQVRINKKRLENDAKQLGMAYSLISGVQKIKLAGAEKRAFSKWLNLYSEGAELIYNPPLLIKIYTVINLAITLFSTIILYYLAAKSGVDASAYLAFNAAYGSLNGAFMALESVALQTSNIKPMLELAAPILTAEPEMADNKEYITKISGGIELNNVCFRYGEDLPYIIKNLSLKIKAGEYVAVVGRTGCGKSTLMRLLLGFEKPELGAIYYDGKDIENIDLTSLRRKIGAVTQDGGLFQGDIYSNIIISAPDLTVKEAWEAAEIAGIAEDIKAMPMGMQTIVSEGQGGLSGGQRQRLMIARAIAPKPKLLIFDEATSALDNKTQKQVSEALDKMGCTRIVIAHRLSTIRNCDRILVLDGGNIVEDGSYDELMAKEGFFAELVKRQKLEYSSESTK